MRYAWLAVALCSCAPGDTTLTLTVQLASGESAPGQIDWRVYDRFHSLGSGSTPLSRMLPGPASIALPNVDGPVRVVMSSHDLTQQGAVDVPAHAFANATGTLTLSSCLDDDDGDGVPTPVDNCPTVANTNQADADGNGIGDACEGVTVPWVPLRSTSQTSVPNTTSLSIAPPSGVMKGDLLWMVVETGAGGNPGRQLVADPPGWTLHTTQPAGSCGGYGVWFYYKRADCERGPYTINVPQPDVLSAVIVALRDVDPMLGSSVYARGDGGGSTHMIGPLPMVQDQLLLLMVGGELQTLKPASPDPGNFQLAASSGTQIAIYDGHTTTPDFPGEAMPGSMACLAYDLVALKRKP